MEILRDASWRGNQVEGVIGDAIDTDAVQYSSSRCESGVCILISGMRRFWGGGGVVEVEGVEEKNSPWEENRRRLAIYLEAKLGESQKHRHNLERARE